LVDMNTLLMKRIKNCLNHMVMKCLICNG
jgi:hypothetical protein